MQSFLLIYKALRTYSSLINLSHQKHWKHTHKPDVLSHLHIKTLFTQLDKQAITHVSAAAEARQLPFYLPLMNT